MCVSLTQSLSVSIVSKHLQPISLLISHHFIHQCVAWGSKLGSPRKRARSGLLLVPWMPFPKKIFAKVSYRIFVRWAFASDWSHTLPTKAGMFIELVANPIPYAIADSTPRNLATSFSSSSCLSKFPAHKTNEKFGVRRSFHYRYSLWEEFLPTRLLFIKRPMREHWKKIYMKT